jgi:ribosomal protein S18 acetylase RimI-like enzyme
VVTTLRLASERSRDDGLVDELVGVVNRAFLAGDAGLWTRDIDFTSSDEVRSWIAAGQVVAAIAPTVAGELRTVGAVRTRSVPDRARPEAWFGTLTVDPEHAGLGVGRQLVDHVEAEAATDGNIAMNIEALAADPRHAGLDRILAWYQRLGYEEVGRQDPAEAFPEFTPFAITKLEIIQMRKPLRAAR